MRLPDFIVDVLDPAGRYMRAGRPRPHRRDMPRQFAAYTPVGAKQRRTLDPEERRQLLAQHKSVRDRRPPPTRIDEEAIAAAATELAARGNATLRGRDARLLRFWHGDAVLKLDYPGNQQQTRIFRRALRDPDSLKAELAKHLSSMLGRA